LAEFSLSGEVLELILDQLAAVLHLGNIDLANLDSDDSMYALHYCSQLLSLDADSVLMFLSGRQQSAGDYKPVTPEEMRDALARRIYERLFGFILERINEATMYIPETPGMDNAKRYSSRPPSTRYAPYEGTLCWCINIMDISGFEVQDHNTFSQFTINL